MFGHVLGHAVGTIFEQFPHNTNNWVHLEEKYQFKNLLMMAIALVTGLLNILLLILLCLVQWHCVYVYFVSSFANIKEVFLLRYFECSCLPWNGISRCMLKEDNVSHTHIAGGIFGCILVLPVRVARRLRMYWRQSVCLFIYRIIV